MRYLREGFGAFWYNALALDHTLYRKGIECMYSFQRYCCTSRDKYLVEGTRRYLRTKDAVKLISASQLKI